MSLTQAVAYWKDRAEMAERRNLLNPEGTEYVAELEARLERQQAVIEAAQRFMDAADLSRAVIPEPPSEWRTDFYAYHDARHDLYQALATLTQEDP